MNTRSSYTGRAPRTLNEAFGPYQSQHFIDLNPPRRDWDGIVIAGSLILTIVVLCVAHWI